MDLQFTIIVEIEEKKMATTTQDTEEKSKIENSISTYESNISSIDEDIRELEKLAENNDSYREIYSDLMYRIYDYDITKGDTWRKNLCDIADDKKENLAYQVGLVNSKVLDLKSEIENAIYEAKKQKKAFESKKDELEKVLKDM